MTRAELRVRRIDRLGDDVAQFEFVPARPGFRLWAHPPGAHITVATPVRANCYSLTGDGVRPDAYRISVRRVGDDGGSAWLHEHLAVGHTVTVSPPTSMFAPVTTARHHLLVAAGIGVTPILSHARAARRWGRPFEVIYGHPAGRAPHRDELAALAGAAFTDAVGRDALLERLAGALRRQPVGTHAYACGPSALLDAFVDLAERSGWPEERIHVEHFTTPPLGPGEPFTMRIVGRGVTVDVPVGVSALRALDSVGVTVPRLCERGVCGQCRTGVAAGLPDHRDMILSRSERAANDCFYPCVSRALTADLEVTVP
jgi:dimethylamine monooxygenase subunit B